MKKRSKFGTRLIVSCLAMCLCFVSLFFVSAAAASCSETITIEQYFSSSPDSTTASTCQYELAPVDNASPLPESAEDGKFIVTLVRRDSASVTIPFTHAGNFEYRLTPLEMPGRLRYTYDDSEYLILVQVRNTEDGGLKSAAYISMAGEKVEGIQYRHKYRPHEPDPTPTPVPDPVPNPTPNPAPTQNPSNGTGNGTRPGGRPNTLQLANPWGSVSGSTEDDEPAPESSPSPEKEEDSSIGDGKTPLGGGEDLADGKEPSSTGTSEEAGSPRTSFHVCIWFILFLIALAALALFMILWARRKRREDR